MVHFLSGAFLPCDGSVAWQMRAMAKVGQDSNAGNQLYPTLRRQKLNGFSHPPSVIASTVAVKVQPMDDKELELAKAAAEGTAAGLTRSFHEIVSNLGGPVSVEIGLELRDLAREARLRRAIRMGRRSISILDRDGARRRSVPIKVLLPTFEHGSLEDDPDLEERWVALLANAGDATAQDVTRT
jgi:hypothetical protein